jgi:threonine dehydrogenase-like Zn-dependent dehydrogenase
MSENRIVHALGIEGIGKAYLHSYEEGPLPDHHFRLDTLYSGISAGTERSFLQGTNPYLHSRWDDEFGLFCQGEPSLHYPMPFLGYMEVGQVSESRAATVKEGDIVAMAYGHKTGHTADALHEFFVRLPPHIDPLLGIYVAQMGPICANGILHAAADVVGHNVRDLSDGVQGRHVMVIGSGVVGILTALFAHCFGAADVIVVNGNTTSRLQAAESLGLTVVNEAEVEPGRFCKERWHHGPRDRGADVVFQTRPQPTGLQLALQSLRPQGTVIDLAFYQTGACDVRLGEEFHHNGLSVRCAQIGRVPRGLAHSWTKGRLAILTLDLLQAYGSLIREHLITHLIPFSESLEFMSQLTRYRPEILQAVLEVEHD